MNLKILGLSAAGGFAAMAIIVPVAFAASDASEGAPATTGTDSSLAPASGEQLRMSQGPGGRAAFHRGGPAGAASVVTAAAEVLGITVDELKAELADGSTILDAAIERGLDTAAFTADVTAAVRANIEEALANGEINQETADRLLADLDARVAEALASAKVRGGPGCDDGEGGTAPDEEQPEDGGASTEA